MSFIVVDGGRWWVAGVDKCQSRATIYVNGPQAVPVE